MPDAFQRLRKIDDAIRDDHFHVSQNDEILFWREYTSRRNYSFSDTNQFVSNLKKKPSTSNQHELGYKSKAIKTASAYFTRAIHHAWLKNATLVPMPCSKTKEHADYDDRILRICQGIQCEFTLDIRELVVQTRSMKASHEYLDGEHRPTVAEIMDAYKFVDAMADPKPVKIAIFDDVITAGTHLRALSNVIREKWPDIPIVGFFIARRIFPPD